MSDEARTPGFYLKDVEAAIDGAIERAVEYALMGKPERAVTELEQDLAMRLYAVDLKLQEFARQRMLRHVLHLLATADNGSPALRR